MKTLTSLLAVFLLSAGFAAAQDLNGMAATTVHSSGSSDLTGFSTTNIGPGVTPASIKAPPNPKVVLKPEFHGVFVDGVKYGPEIISPAAPASWGVGQKYLSAPSSRADLQHESGQAAHRDAGGIKLFTFEF